MNPLRKKARIAGLWYLVMAVTGPVGLIYVPNRILVEGDPSATAQNILELEFLFRTGIAANIICQTAFIFLVLALYHLFIGVNKKQALLMLVLVVVAVPIAFLNEIHQLNALFIMKGSLSSISYEPDILHSQVFSFFKQHAYGTKIVSVLWGLWLFPFGLLVYRSGFIPRIFGVLLMIACAGYVLDTFLWLLLPNLPVIISQVITMPSAIGELSIMLWLLIKGVKETPETPE